MAGHLEGAVALVTGAKGGIGIAACQTLMDDGATVIAAGRGAAPATLAPGLDWIDLDVTDAAQWDSAAAQVASRHGRLDILVHNAGISPVEKFETMTLDGFRATMAVNVEGVVLGTQKMLPLLKASGPARRGGASVIMVSSVAGFIGAEFMVAYCTSKGALRMMTKAIAMECSALGYKIRVNSLHPGGVDTGMLDGIFQRYVDIGVAPSAEEAYEASAKAHPVGRMAKPQEVADAIRFLASDESSYMHASEMVLDGGYLAH